MDNATNSRRVSEQVAEMRALQDAALQLERGGTVSLRSSKKQRHSVADLLAHYLRDRSQNRGRWFGQKITRDDLETYARERGVTI